MKKIINGKLYDTDTAKELGAWHNTSDYRDFHYVHETLYRKRTGEFFLYGEGGPMTKYAESCGQNSWSDGEKIIPLSADAAREWAEKNLTADEYAEIFGMPDEGEETAALNVQIDAALMAKLRQLAGDNGISLRACLEDILKKTL